MGKKEDIQTTIINAARSGTFYRVTYSNNLPTVNTVSPVAPNTIQCNETNCVFEVDRRNGKGHTQRRREWGFQLILAFNREVTIEPFVDFLSDPALKAYDNANKFIGTLELRSCAAVHPTTKQGSTGSEFVLNFSVNNIRKE